MEQGFFAVGTVFPVLTGTCFKCDSDHRTDSENSFLVYILCMSPQQLNFLRIMAKLVLKATWYSCKAIFQSASYSSQLYSRVPALTGRVRFLDPLCWRWTTWSWDHSLTSLPQSAKYSLSHTGNFSCPCQPGKCGVKVAETDPNPRSPFAGEIGFRGSQGCSGSNL